MKKKMIITVLVICTMFTLLGCSSNKRNNVEKRNETSSAETTETTTASKENETEKKYTVMLDDKLYVDTDETNSQLRCGNMDFDLKYTGSLDDIPSKNGQTNCKVQNKGGQYSWRENRIEICVDDTWHILAHNENNLEGVSMRVTENTNTSVTLEIVNKTDKDVQGGEYFCLEKKDDESGEWRRVQTIIDNYAFNDIAYIVQKDKPFIEKVEFEWLYGKLNAGTYRVVKEIMDFRETENYTIYWYSAEFMVTE